MQHEKPGDGDPRTSAPDGRIKAELSIGERLGWGNLFNLTANYQKAPPDGERTFGHYFGDASPDQETQFTREIGVYPFLPDVSGRPQGILLNVYLDTEHTQFFIGTAVWGEKGPEVRSVIDLTLSEYLQDKALNRLQASEEALKIIFREEAEIIGMTGEGIEAESETTVEAQASPMSGMVFTPPESGRLN